MDLLEENAPETLYERVKAEVDAVSRYLMQGRRKTDDRCIDQDIFCISLWPLILKIEYE